jgi:hypothetical protein
MVKKKSLSAILFFVIVLSFIFFLPLELYANPIIYKEGNFEMKITPGYYNVSNQVILKYNSSTPINPELGYFMMITAPPSIHILEATNMRSEIPSLSFPFEITCNVVIPDIPGLVYGVQLCHFEKPGIWGGNIITDWSHFIPFTLTYAPPEEPVWVRDHPMTCYQVWVNSDNMFEMVFWWPYRDNNWVKIYDMSGKEVFSIDMPYDNPNIIVDLPDGIYTVKTFTAGSTEPIQTFVIGK